MKKVTRKRNPRVYKRYNNKRAVTRRTNAPKNNTVMRKRRAFAKKRSPFVEIKSRSHLHLWETMGGSSSTHPIVDTITNPQILTSMTNTDTARTPKRSHLFPIWSYMNPIQGVTEKDMLGTTLTGKYLTAKVNFQWPSDLQTNNPKYYMIHGWIRVPTNLTQFTTPTRTGFTRTQLLQHILNHISRDFDESTKDEFLQFKERSNKDYIVLGYKRIKPNQNELQVPTSAYLAAPSSADSLGRLGQLSLTFKWPVNDQKIKFSKGTETPTAGVVGAPFYYNNAGYQPFLLYYCPSAGEGIGPQNGMENSPSIAYNDKFWFSDS